MIILNDWALFFGRFHPLLVHLPIGFLLVVGVLELLIYLKKIYVNLDVIKIILLISAISAALACGAGYLLSLEGGYNEEILSEHQNQGLFLAGFTLVAYLTKTSFFSNKFHFSKWIYFPSIIFATLLLFVAGHHGGNLTHGETYLTDNTPQPLRSWLGIPEKIENENQVSKKKISNINEALVFQDLVQPIFKEKCEKCHNASKMKGDLRMDTIELLKKGGEHGAIFVVGKSDESEFIKRILLPESNDDHMPPNGKTQITENELALLKWWIDNGASFDKKVSEIPQNDMIKPILASFGGVSSSNTAIQNTVKQIKFVIEEKLLSEKVEPIGNTTSEEIKKSGGLILPFAQNNNFVEISYVNNPKLTDNQSGAIQKAADQTLWLRLSNTQITDKTLSEISKLKKITRLYLENTKITDAGLSNLQSLENLEYLNLVGTGISDNSIKSLLALKNLKKLYVWQTRLSQNGIDELKKNLPDLVIESGVSEQQIAEFLKIEANDVSDDVYKPKAEPKKAKK